MRRLHFIALGLGLGLCLAQGLVPSGTLAENAVTPEHDASAPVALQETESPTLPEPLPSTALPVELEPELGTSGEVVLTPRSPSLDDPVAQDAIIGDVPDEFAPGKIVAGSGHRHPEAQGKVIRSITVAVTDVFERPDHMLFRTANSIKVNTRHEVVKRELVFREGDIYDDFNILESERRLRELKYLRRIVITPKVDGDFVDLVVAVQDVWTFLPQFGFNVSAGREKASVALIETNFLGLGKRVELGYEREDSREISQAVYDDNRIFGTDLKFVGALFDRSDGHEGLVYLGKPFRSLVDKQSYYVSARTTDTVGRLFEDGSESYIFRQDIEDTQARYTWAVGDPRANLNRYSLGYQYQREFFDVAGPGDFEDLDLDPNEVSNDPERLPENRTFTGPSFGFSHIEPDFIRMNYVDRFERVEDFNIGSTYDVNFTFAPEVLGSHRDTLLLSLNRSVGYQFSRGAFIRAEAGFASRLEDSEWRNTLGRFEVKYYNVLGDVSRGETFLGKHTLAASYYVDYGDRLDGDRQFAIGGDNALRGYKSRAFTGDKRMVLNLEDRVHFVDDLFQLVSVGAAAFIDVGGATYDDLEDILGKDLYGNAGVGLRLGFPRSTGGGVVRIDVAVPFRDADDGTGAFEVRIVVGGGQLFSSALRSESFGPDRANIAIGFDR